MSEKKFTPGDWAIDPCSDQTIAIYVANGDRHICTIEERGYGEEFREGDAALIIAAPDLLAACKALRLAALNLRGEYAVKNGVSAKTLMAMFQADDLGQAAIAKATAAEPTAGRT